MVFKEPMNTRVINQNVWIVRLTLRLECNSEGCLTHYNSIWFKYPHNDPIVILVHLAEPMNKRFKKTALNVDCFLPNMIPLRFQKDAIISLRNFQNILNPTYLSFHKTYYYCRDQCHDSITEDCTGTLINGIKFLWTIAIIFSSTMRLKYEIYLF